MSKIQAWSSVTISDQTDAGTLNMALGTNLPQSIIYNPNQGTYTPDWSTTNLTLTPSINHDGTTLSLTASGLTITWKRQEGSGTPTVLQSGETASNGVLTVSANKLANITSRLLTYICSVSYVEPDSGLTVTNSNQMTFNLLNDATEAKYCSITGESVFLYDTTGTLKGANTITLTANLTNVSMSQWQYKNTSGTFVAFPTTNNESITGNTIKVVAGESAIWINDLCTVKLATVDSSVYDIFTVQKLHDGAAGNSTVSAVLSNENHIVPVSSTGTVKSFTGADTSITVYEGGTDVTESWSITVSNGTGLTGTYDSATHIFSPTALSVDSSYAEFTCTRSGYANIIKRYTITKQYAGKDAVDAVIYQMETSVLALNLNVSGVFNPTTVTFYGYTKTGATLVKSNYSGRFIISESTDGSTFSTKYTSTSDEASKTYTPSANTIKAIKCTLYASGGTTQMLDEQTIVITKDGTNGTNGTNGSGGTSVVVGNDSEVIACTTGGTAVAAKDITIPFSGYIGTTRSAITCTIGTLPTGVSTKSNTAGTASAAGSLVLSVAAGATFGSASLLSGDITLTFTCNSSSVEKKFTWTKSLQAASSVILQIYAPNGDTILNSANNVTLSTTLMSGASIVTASSYKWYQFASGSYTLISSATGSSLTVTPTMVDSMAFFKCIATYNGVDYSAYWTVNDKTDPVDAFTFCTIGEQITNKNEYGAIYTRVYRNGAEIDPIKSLVFSTTAPSSPATGDYYYYINTTAKTITLKKYSGTAWADATAADNDTLTYAYYRTKNGVELDTTEAYKTTRVFYVDRDLIDGKTIYKCNVHD